MQWGYTEEKLVNGKWVTTKVVQCSKGYSPFVEILKSTIKDETNNRPKRKEKTRTAI